MKKHLFLLLSLVFSIGAFASLDQVPSDADLADYYNSGDVCMCFFVPADINCNAIVVTGSFNGWKSNAAECIAVEPVVGFEGWYVASFEPEAEPDAEKGIQAKPVMLDAFGQFNWEYQIGAATAIRGGVQVVQGAFAGEIELINYGADAPNVFTVDAWKQNPCTAIYHNYTVTVISAGCDGYAVPFLIGNMTSWQPQQMLKDEAATIANNAPTYYISFKTAEGTAYQILSGLMDEGGEIEEQPAWRVDEYIHVFVDGEWTRYNPNNSFTGEVENIVYDLRVDTMRWARCEAPNSNILTVSQAISRTMLLDSAATSGIEYTIEGYVVDATPFNPMYGNQIWYMVDDLNDAFAPRFYAYNCTPVENGDTLKVLNGDKVHLTGKLTKYYNKNMGNYQPEIKMGIASFVSKVEGDHTVSMIPEKITVAQAIEIGQTLEEGTQTEQQYIITGYVSALAGRATDFELYGNQTYWITDEQGSTAASTADGALQVFQGVAAEEVHVWDKVTIYGKIRNYNGTLNVERPQVTILEKNHVDEPTSYSPIQIGDLYYLLDKGTQTAAVTYKSFNKNNYMYKYNEDWDIETAVIPATVTCNDTVYAVTRIGWEAFGNCQNLTSVTIGDNVRVIDVNAFSHCTNLQEVTISNSVDTIGDDAFYGCSALTSIVIPASVKDIGQCAFFRCNNLTSVTINSNAIVGEDFTGNYIRELADIFEYQVQEYIIGEGVTRIGYHAFNHFSKTISQAISNLTSISLPSTLTDIANEAFYNCVKLSSLTIPDGVTTIGDDAFLNVRCVTYNGNATGAPWGALNLNGNCETEPESDPDSIESAVISVTDNSLADWDSLPAEYVSEAVCPNDAAYTGLKNVKVYATKSYINILVEPNMEEITDLDWVPFHIFIDTDNSDATGGYDDLFTDANADIMLEGALFADNEPYTYAPGVWKWWGDVGGYGWEWTDPETDPSYEDCSGAIVCEGELADCSSQYVDGKFEIQILRNNIPATWNDTVFGIGFDIQQNWSAVGILPIASVTDDNPTGKANKMEVRISDIIPLSEVVQLPYSESFLGDIGLFSIQDIEKDTLSHVWQTTDRYGMKANGYYSGPHNTESWLVSPKISLPAAENIQMSFETCLNYASDDYNSCAVKVSTNNGITWSDLQFNKWPAGHSWVFDTVMTSLDAYAGNEIQIAFVYRSSTLYSNATWEVRNLVIQLEEPSVSPTRSIDLDLTSSQDWTVIDATLNEAGSDDTNGKYAYDIMAGVPGIAYVTTEPDVRLISQNSADKSKAFTITDQYFMFGGKSGIIKIMNTIAGDKIVLTVAAKGSTSASFIDEVGEYPINAVAVSTDLTLPAKDKTSAEADENGCIWRELEFVSTGGDVEIKECVAGFCIKRVVVETESSHQVNYDDVLIDNLYYKLDPDNKTAQVRRADNTPENVIIPSTVLYQGENYTVVGIGQHAFSENRSIVSVTIPNSVESIGEFAFYECENLVSVNISSGVIEIGKIAFGKCSSLSTITIPSSVTSIGSAAFSSCSSLTSVTIPNSVTNLEDQIFNQCYSLTAIDVATDNQSYCSVDGVLFNKDTTTILTYPNGKHGAYVIPDGVVRIENYAFMYCENLTSVEIPNTVQTIGEWAFCICRGLSSIYIPNSVHTIEAQAFRSCQNLKSIICESPVPPTCEEEVFLYVNKRITSLIVPAGSEATYASANEWKEFVNIIPDRAPEVTVIEPTAEPTTNSVVIEWPQNETAETYTIDIMKGDEIICTLEFDAQGQLLNITYAAPGRKGVPHQSLAALQTSTGWQYTISGLDANTEYTYIVTAKNGENVVYEHSVTFTTQDTATGIDTINPEQEPAVHKLLRDGQILILRGDKTYTLTGQEIIVP